MAKILMTLCVNDDMNACFFYIQEIFATSSQTYRGVHVIINIMIIVIECNNNYLVIIIVNLGELNRYRGIEPKCLQTHPNMGVDETNYGHSLIVGFRRIQHPMCMCTCFVSSIEIVL